MGLINERLKWHDSGVGSEAGRTRYAGHASAAANSARYFLSELLPVTFELDIFCVVRISEEATFYKHCRHSCFAQNVIAATTHAPIRRGRPSGDIIMNG